MGLPHAIAVTTADVTDRDGAIQMILVNLDNLSCVKKFLVDGGYTGERFANQVKEICNAQVEVVKRNELHRFVVLPRRWVVERLFGWLDKFRRLWKNCERKLVISAQILTFALIAILIRRYLTGSKVVNGSYKVMCIPPTYVYRPCTAAKLKDYSGFYEAIDRMAYTSADRKEFLKNRYEYWKAYGSNPNPGLFDTSDKE